MLSSQQKVMLNVFPCVYKAMELETLNLGFQCHSFDSGSFQFKFKMVILQNFVKIHFAFKLLHKNLSETAPSICTDH